MISEELLVKIREVDSRRIEIAGKTTEGIALLKSVYFLVFKERYEEGCGPCHERAFYRLIKILNNPEKFIPMTNKKYILKDGHQVSIFGSPDIYTNDNLTDEVAEQLLKDRPALKKSFRVINGKGVSDETTEETKASNADAPVTKRKHTEVIADIKVAKTAGEAKELAKGDDRQSVKDALAKRLLELPEEEPKKTKVLTPEDFEEDPTLAEQGLKVGDTVEIEEEE